MQNIKDAKTFDEVVQIRQEVYAANLRGDNHFEDVLVGLYKEDTHFIYELLQNADDVNATEIEITLSSDELIFWHNSTQDFNLKDVIAITGIGSGTKKDEPNKIGKFGIGFKSVFAVTESPRIFSGIYNFEIKHFTVPAIIDKDSIYRDYGTTFVLPFNHREKTREDIYSDIERALDQLDANAFMFLNNIENVSWTSDTDSGSLIKEIRQYDGYMTMSIMTSNDEILNEFMIFNAPLSVAPNLNVSIAYKTEMVSGKPQIVPMPNSKLSVYFLTETVTYLNFIVNGPFQTSSTRESVDGTKQHNQMVLADIASLYEKSLLILRDKGLLNERLLEMLPIDRSYRASSFVYDSLYKITFDSIKNENLLPTKNNNFSRSGEALLARGAELTELLSNEDDINLVFKKNTWLSTLITADRTPKLRDYLMKEHNVSEITYPAFCRSLTREFIEGKSDNWLLDFYMECGRRSEREVWQVLRTKPIIRTEADTIVVPFLKDLPNVFLPSPSTPQEKAIKSTLIENDEAKEFLIGLGIENINVTDELRTNILPAFRKTQDSTSLLNYFGVFLQAYTSAKDAAIRKGIAELLEDEKIVLFEDAKDGSESWDQAGKGYIKSQQLETLFDGYDAILFASPKLFCEQAEAKDVLDFLVALGIDTTLFKIPNQQLSESRKEQLRAGTRCSYDKVENYDLHGLQYIIDNITEERSRTLFALLAEQNADFFMGRYTWDYHHSHASRVIRAHFVEILNESAWIIDAAGGFIKPVQMKRQQVIDYYGIPSDAPVLQYLSFLPDAIDLLPEELKQKLELTKDIPIEMLQKLKEEHDNAQQTSFEEQVIEEDPGLGAAPIIAANPPVHSHDEPETETPAQQDTDRPDNGKGSDEGDPSYIIKKRVVIRTADNKRKTIGEWAEEKVMVSLQAQYGSEQYSVELTKDGFIARKGTDKIEVKNKNVKQGNHPGYDFEILLNDEIKEYVEVKAKVSDEPELFSVSGKQWDMAKALYNDGNGDRYSIYVVTSAGKAGAKINTYKNPYKLWVDNLIYADPVNIEL